MRQLIIKLCTLLAAITLSVNLCWGDNEPQKIYLASMQAQVSPASSGSGRVQLTWLDIKGTPMTSDIAQQIQSPNPTGPAATAQVLGGTLCAMEGVEVNLLEIGGTGSQIYMTSFLYFQADGVPDNGSYLDGWTFTDPAITRQDTAMDKAHPESAYFKLLPDSANNALYPSAAVYTVAGQVMAAPNNIYAVFKKYILSNPTATSATLDAVEGQTATLYASVDVEGDLTVFDLLDVAMPSFSENSHNQWSYNLLDMTTTPVSERKVRVTVPVTFTAWNGITANSYKTTLTVKMEGENPSTLNIPLTVDALDPNRPAVILYNGKDSITSGAWENMYAIVGSYANPVLKLNQDCSDLTLEDNKTFTLDLNGNTAGDITISSGEVTIAYSNYGGTAGALNVTGGKVILNGGTFASLTNSAIVEQNGATITGATTNSGTLTTTEGAFQGGLTSNGTLTLNGGSFNGTTAITISGGTANINRGTITGTTCGLKVTAGTATVKKLAAITGGTYSAQRIGGTLTILSGKFGALLDGTMDFTAGYFKTNNYGVSTEGKTEMQVVTGVEYNEGYRYFLGTTESAKDNGVGVCRIGNVSYSKLEDAIAYANNNPNQDVVIFMTNNYILPAGNYTLPAKATLVIPMADDQNKEANKIAPRVSFNDMNRSHPYLQPTEFRRLTFANGVNMDVFGTIEMTGTQFASNEAYTAMPYGPYGHLVMEEGSHITLQAGSELRAWGFMTGKGETDARRNSTVREMFQMGDWKGAMTSVKITGMFPTVGDDSDKKIFPVSQYFIQNVESPVKYHPGAVLSTAATVSEGLMKTLAVTMAANDIKVVGVSGRDAAIFLMDNDADADNTWVRKWYDTENDIQVYDINSSAHIGSMVLDMGELNIPIGKFGTIPVRLNSANFDLPIASNMKIHLLTGRMDFQQNTSLLPGAEVEVDKESTVSVAQDENDTEHTGALYVYDADDWDKYAFCHVGEEYGTAYTKVVRYTPSWNGRPTKRNEQTCPPDAAINVHGTFSTEEGYVYTSEHGANIFSSNEDAGTFIFNQDAPGEGTRTVNQVKGESSYEERTFYSANLKNGDGTHENTKNAEAGDAYCYKDYLWTIMKVDEDDNCFMVDNHGNFYAKPADYVAINATKIYDDINDEYVFKGNDDHTFSDAAGTGRLFILMPGNCQWWEGELKDNLFHCIHPQNDTYYYWDEDEEEWLEQKFTITWKNWDGTVITTNGGIEGGESVTSYQVTYGTQAEFFGTNPTREKTIDYTYDFTGWNPTPGIVTSDVTYTATFEQKDRQYTITFQNEGGSLIETQFLKHNDVPVCENTPTKVGHFLKWVPAIAAVTGDAIYTATWLEDKPTTYNVRFVDYDGTTPLNGEEGENVAVGTDASTIAPATPNNKPETSEFTYVFDHWSPTLHDVDDDITYTAVYREVAKTYTITFLNEDNSEIEQHEYAYGETPVCSATPTKENTAEFTYSFAWTPQIQSVMGPATYKAKFTPTTNKYTVTLQSNMGNACTLAGAGIYEYGANVTLHAEPKTGYTFTKWQETDNTDDINLTVIGNVTYTAIMAINETVITDTTVALGATYDVPENTKVKDLILCSNGEESGSITHAENLQVTGNAYFDLTLNATAGQWYAVAVPWYVSVANGIYINGAKKTLNQDYWFVEYNSALRATNGIGDNGNECWQFVNSGNLQPGRFYMMYLRNNATTIRFAKVVGTSFTTYNKVSLSMYPQSTGDDKDANWNGIANPAVYYTGMNELNSYDKKAQVFDKSLMTLVPVTLSTYTFKVGEPVFIQAESQKTVTLSAPSNTPAPARRLAPAAEESKEYDIRIAQEDKPYTGRVFISTSDDKADKYIIGQDLAKMGTSSIAAQLWVERYNTRLCVNRTQMNDNQAYFPLGIFAPKAGEYLISSAVSAAEGEEIYVTLNGTPVWNLAAGAYTAILPAGNSTQYGLLVTRQNAPAMPTDIEETATENDAVRKVLIGSQIYILREGAVYTVTGQKLQ